jgi:hypothetical protein
MIRIENLGGEEDVKDLATLFGANEESKKLR